MEISTSVAMLSGTIIGGTISIITNYLQQRNQFKRELYKIAYEMAVKEYDTLIQLKKGENYILAPLEQFVTYYVKYLNTIENSNFKVEDLIKVRKFRKELDLFYKKELKKNKE